MTVLNLTRTCTSAGIALARQIAATRLNDGRMRALQAAYLELEFAEQLLCRCELAEIRAAKRGETKAEIVETPREQA